MKVHRNLVVIADIAEEYQEIVFRIRTTTRLSKLKEVFAEKVGLPRCSLQFKIGGVEIKDEDTAEALLCQEYDKIFVSRRQVKRTQQRQSEISRFEEELKYKKEITKGILVKEIESKKENLELYKQNKAEELEPLEKAMKTMKISIEKMMNSITEVKRLHLLEVEKKEDEIRIAKSELESFERSYQPTSETMKKDFDCPVCYELMANPRRIYQCLHGHLICQNCRDRPEIRTCPVCRINLGPRKENLSRNLAMETLAGNYLNAKI